MQCRKDAWLWTGCTKALLRACGKHDSSEDHQASRSADLQRAAHLELFWHDKRQELEQVQVALPDERRLVLCIGHDVWQLRLHLAGTQDSQHFCQALGCTAALHA